MTRFTSTVLEDPKLWCIDRVVHEFCYNDSPIWLNNSETPIVPDREGLEQIFRSNHLDGDNLLTIDESSLKSELAIKSYGQRRYLWKAIQHLRSISPSYPETLSRFEAAPLIQANSQVFDNHNSILNRSPPYVDSSLLKSGEQPQSVVSGSSTSFTGSGAPSNSVAAQLQLNSSRNTSPYSTSPSSLTRQSEPGSRLEDHTSKTKTSERQNGLLRTPGQTAASNELKDRAYLASASKSGDFVEVGLAGLSVELNETEKQSETIRADLLPLRKKKRVAPTPIALPRENPNLRSIRGERNDSTEKTAYLSSKKISMYQTFYGLPPKDNEKICLGSSNNLQGAKMGVARRMKHFLQQPIQYHVESMRFFKIPYRKGRLINPSTPRYFSSFATGHDPVIHRVLPLVTTPKHKESSEVLHSLNTLHLTISDPTKDILSGIETESEGGELGSNDYNYLLSKYPINDNDDGLPLYGDSGDENNFDEETLDEIESEHKELLNSYGVLNRTEVAAVIEDSLQDLRKEWKETKLTKVQQKAYNLWLKAARQKSRKAEIENAIFWKKRSSDRLYNLRETIINESWRKTSDIKQQCQSLEQSVFLLMENDYYLNVLKRNEAPELPKHFASPQSRIRKTDTADGEEVLGSDSESELAFIEDGNDGTGDDLEVNSATIHSMDLDWNPNIPGTAKRHYTKHVNKSRQNQTSSLVQLGAQFDSNSADERKLRSSQKKRKYDRTDLEGVRARLQPEEKTIQYHINTQRCIQQEKFASTGVLNKHARYAVNFEEPIVYLDSHISQRIMPHQLKGIQFMWREVVQNSSLQGCLLAHTMGLGKTMQVISLLVTISQCAQSTDISIRSLVPIKLRENKVLILCPAGLLDNWVTELVTWSPSMDTLGIIRKVTKGSEKPRISAWKQEGGVLIMSYGLLTSLLSPPVKKPAFLTLQTLMEETILGTASIIIADEAHMMKNPQSKVNAITKRFTSNSRIALTGSPLNNHLEEYHTMVDWIAPGYLGDIKQFRHKYSDPINSGLYADSTAFEQQLSRRRLHLLKEELADKIDRADISTIAKDMEPKTEFYITIPLTDVQKQAYNIYVEYFLATHNATGTTMNTRLWEWLAILVLLCNHPSCFIKKLKGSESQPKAGLAISDSQQENLTDQSKASPDELPDDVDIKKSDPLFQVMEKALKVFETYSDGCLEDVRLSYRSFMVKQILEAAKAAGDKTLIFSHSIPTLDYLESLLTSLNLKYFRIDGTTALKDRQEAIISFNNSAEGVVHAFLISTKAGGLGFNLQGANRVIIYDFNFNPMWEEQAIARAYRMGQKKPVFVYRFRAGGTFEEAVYNKAIFKTQLFQRVIDKKDPMRHASKSVTDYLFPVKNLERKLFKNCEGKDPNVLDHVMKENDFIQNIELTETFQAEDDTILTEDEVKLATRELQDDPFARRLQKRPVKGRASQQNISAMNIAAIKMDKFAYLPPQPGFTTSPMPNPYLPSTRQTSYLPFADQNQHTPLTGPYQYVDSFSRHPANVLDSGTTAQTDAVAWKYFQRANAAPNAAMVMRQPGTLSSFDTQYHDYHTPHDPRRGSSMPPEHSRQADQDVKKKPEEEEL